MPAPPTDPCLFNPPTFSIVISRSSVSFESTRMQSKVADEQLATTKKAVGSAKHGSVAEAGVQPFTLAPACQATVVSKARGCMPSPLTEPCLFDPTTFCISANCSSTSLEPTRVYSDVTDEKDALKKRSKG